MCKTNGCFFFFKFVVMVFLTWPLWSCSLICIQFILMVIFVNRKTCITTFLTWLQLKLLYAQQSADFPLFTPNNQTETARTQLPASLFSLTVHLDLLTKLFYVWFALALFVLRSWRTSVQEELCIFGIIQFTNQI